MRGTPRKHDTATKNQKTPSKSPLKESNSKNSLSQSKDALSQDPYFCHFRNAMYMGRAKVFQKDGKGILLHDDGTSAITSYEKDMLQGYNLLLTPQNSLISANYNRNKLVQAAYKTDSLLFFGRFNNLEQLEGSSTVINFIKRQITYVNTKKGQILEKADEKNESLLSRVFDLNNLQGVVPAEHLKLLNFEIQKGKSMDVIRRGSKITIGYTKNGFLNGLGIVIGYKVDPNGMTIDNSSIQLIERGYYKNQQLNGLGERRFKNGNVYVGEFKNDQFEGTGILKNNVKMNWASGQFQRGNLVELGKYSNDGQSKNAQKILQSIHQRKTSWVSKDVSLTNTAFLDRQIEKINSFKNNQQMMSLEVRRQDILRRIQENFINDADDNAQQAHLKMIPGLLDSPLQKYLKTQPGAGLMQHNEVSPVESRRLSSSRRNRIFHQGQSFKNKEGQDDSYHFQINPVPVQNMYSSRSKKEQFQPVSQSFRLAEQTSGSFKKQQSPRQKLQSYRQSGTATFTGPKVHIFETADKTQQRRASRSPFSASDMKKRKEDIIESMYKRELKRSLM